MAKRKKKLMPPVNPITSTANQHEDLATKTNKPGLRIMGRRLSYPVIGGKQLSHMHMAVFVVVFAAIGATLIFFSHAATSPVATIEAENMTLPASASIIPDSTASGANGGSAAVLTQAGTSLSGAVSLPSPVESLTVTAKGTKCKGAWPSMTVSVGGATVLGPTQVSSSSWKSYSIAKSLAAGSPNLDIKYASSRAGCSSKLYVDVTNFYGPAPITTPAPIINNLSALPTSVTSGGTSTLSWTSTNATGCTLDGGTFSNSAQPTSGSASTGALSSATMYTLNCAGTGGNTNANVTVAVSASSAFPWLSVKGNRIVTASTGQDVILRGANIMESEWKNGYCSATGHYADANGLACDTSPVNMAWEDKAVPVLADTWKGNIMVHGFASDPINQNNAAYLSIMDHYVKLATDKHMYIVFSWRSYQQNDCQPMKPDTGAYTGPSTHGSCVGTGATQALATLAKIYKDDPHVIISLQVEPHDVTWSTLRPIFENMIDQIRTAASPSVPLIMVPGTGYSRDISGVPADPVKRTNIVYKTHPYNHSVNFGSDFLNTYNAGYPIFIGEFAPTAYMTMDDVNALLSLANQYKLGWAGWSFEYDANPALVDTNVNPTNPFGIAVKNAMLSTPPLPN